MAQAAQTQQPDPKTRTMNFWLGRLLRELREERRVSRSQIAPHVPGREGKPVDVSTLSRFENGDTWTPSPDATVAAYARMCEADPRELWVRAANDFLRKGAAPIAGRQLTPQERALYLAEEARLRTQPSDGESPGKPTSNRR